MRNAWLLMVGLLATGSARAQSVDSTASPWGWGVRVGLGGGSGRYGDARREYEVTAAAPMAGLLLTRYAAAARVSLAAEVLAQRQPWRVDYEQARPFPAYAPHSFAQWRLLVPVYVRTGPPRARLHLLAGAGPTFALGRPAAGAAYYPRAAELTLLLGLEACLVRGARAETTLGARVHVPMTPSYAYGFPSGPASEGRADVGSRWVGLTVGTTLHPPARARP